MFIYKKRFDINSNEVMDFVRLLGNFGLMFQVSDERYIIDEFGHPIYYRRFIVSGTRAQLDKLLETRRIITNYCLH